jgi:hypothetical protein
VVVLDEKICDSSIGVMTENSEKAYLFTAGHCISGLFVKTDPNRITMNLVFESPKKFVMSSAFNNEKSVEFHLRGIVIATSFSCSVVLGTLNCPGAKPNCTYRYF